LENREYCNDYTLKENFTPLKKRLIFFKECFGLDRLQFATKIYARSLKMARRCAISGKGPMSGNNVSHAKNRTKRRFLPNLRTVRVTLEDGTTKKLKISASELRTLKKDS
jgi:large subunit ribosomal protein L28